MLSIIVWLYTPGSTGLPGLIAGSSLITSWSSCFLLNHRLNLNLRVSLLVKSCIFTCGCQQLYIYLLFLTVYMVIKLICNHECKKWTHCEVSFHLPYKYIFFQQHVKQQVHVYTSKCTINNITNYYHTELHKIDHFFSNVFSLLIAQVVCSTVTLSFTSFILQFTCLKPEIL